MLITGCLSPLTYLRLRCLHDPSSGCGTSSATTESKKLSCVTVSVWFGEPVCDDLGIFPVERWTMCVFTSRIAGPGILNEANNTKGRESILGTMTQYCRAVTGRLSWAHKTCSVLFPGLKVLRNMYSYRSFILIRKWSKLVNQAQPILSYTPDKCCLTERDPVHTPFLASAGWMWMDYCEGALRSTPFNC